MFVINLGVVMDPIEDIKPYKDSTFAMMLAAEKRQWPIYYMRQGDLFFENDQVYAKWQRVHVKDDKKQWFEFTGSGVSPLHELADVVLMRKDPPFDMEYVYSTYLLEQAERKGVLVANKPQSLRDANEKLFTTYFPQCCPPTLVSRSMEDLRAFVTKHKDVIVKPLDMMGGASIFRLQPQDQNLSVVLETMTRFETRYIMAQRFIPEIVKGDKRILLVDGVPVPYALARIPKTGETRGNIAAGGRGEGIPLSERDLWICQQVGPTLKAMGLLFVGLDVIGDYLTEINVTSPTCIRELDNIYGLDIASQLLDALEERVSRIKK